MLRRRRVEFAFERGPCDCDRERQKLDPHFVLFHSVSFLFARCFQTNVAKGKQEFSPCFILCRVLLRDAVRCGVRSAEQPER